eukprot:scaffold81415_cov75-Phaeocystis_antarctica.AAC.1
MWERGSVQGLFSTLGRGAPLSALLAHPAREVLGDHGPGARPVVVDQLQQARVLVWRPGPLDDAAALELVEVRLELAQVHLGTLLEVKGRGVVRQAVDVRGQRGVVRGLRREAAGAPKATLPAGAPPAGALPARPPRAAPPAGAHAPAQTAGKQQTGWGGGSESQRRWSWTRPRSRVVGGPRQASPAAAVRRGWRPSSPGRRRWDPSGEFAWMGWRRGEGGRWPRPGPELSLGQGQGSGPGLGRREGSELLPRQPLTSLAHPGPALTQAQL